LLVQQRRHQRHAPARRRRPGHRHHGKRARHTRPGHREPTPILRLHYQGSAERWAIGIYLASSGQYTESELLASFGPKTGTLKQTGIPEQGVDDTFILYADPKTGHLRPSARTAHSGKEPTACGSRSGRRYRGGWRQHLLRHLKYKLLGRRVEPFPADDVLPRDSFYRGSASPVDRRVCPRV
jgi:hypothetical protein